MKGKNEPFGLIKPCGNCPFLKDKKKAINLRPERVPGIIEDLLSGHSGGFACHKTLNGEEVDDDSEDGAHYVPGGGEMQCAGALIVLEKLNRPTGNMKIAERLGMYDRHKLEPYYDLVIDYGRDIK